jgi:hypothetical protein
MPLLLYSRLYKPVQISGLEAGTRLSHAETSQIADSETNIYPGLLLRRGTSANAAKCYIISVGLWLDTPLCLFLSIKLQLEL